jgi:adenosylhomocysteine nucleosidase
LFGAVLPVPNLHRIIRDILRARIVCRTAITIVLIVSIAAGTHVAARQKTDRLFAVIGIRREIKAVEDQIQGAKATTIQGLVFTSGTVGDTRVVTVRTGFGKTDAAMATTLLIDHFSPSAVFFSGTAGAVDPELNPGDIVIGTEVGYHDLGDALVDSFVRSPTRSPISGQRDPLFFPAHADLLAAARRAAATVKPRVREGIIVTGDVFVGSPARRTELRKLNASAVEMEGAAVAQICARFGVPSIIIRSITDHADGTAPQSYAQFVDTASRNAADLVLATIREAAK